MHDFVVAGDAAGIAGQRGLDAGAASPDGGPVRFAVLARASPAVIALNRVIIAGVNADA